MWAGDNDFFLVFRRLISDKANFLPGAKKGNYSMKSNLPKGLTNLVYLSWEIFEVASLSFSYDLDNTPHDLLCFLSLWSCYHGSLCRSFKG